MTGAAAAPLTWPPNPGPAPRWAHRLLHAIADTLEHTWAGHEHTRALLADLTDQPPERGALAPRLQRIAAAAVDPHDRLALHDLLHHHDLDHVADQLTRALRHRGDALQQLRDLAEADQHRLLDTTRIHPRLKQVLDDLTAAGNAIVAADHALLTALNIPPQPGGDCYPQ